MKVDALFYIIGVLLGVFVFGETIPFFNDFFLSGFLGERITLYSILGISAGVIGFFVILMAIGGFWGAEWAEKKFGEKEEV
ncbi:MAG: hypothetical protein ABIJ37_09910 [Pseudomonadota bacterium]